MAFSRVTYTYSGTNNFAVNFTLGYLDQSHVTARVNSEVDGSGDPVYRTLTWLTDSTVSVGGDALVNGDKITLERTVPDDILYHDYTDGEILTEKNLDESYKQAIMLAHQVLDGRFAAFQNNIDMNSFKITGLADAVDDNDAVNFAQLKDYSGDAPTYAAQAQTAANEAAADAILTDADATATAADRAAVEAALAVLPINNFVATTDPTATDDSSENYAVGSRWVNLTSDEAFICVDATEDSAVWVSSTVTSADLGSLAILNNINNTNWSGADLEIANGGTGASTASAARTNLDVYSKSESDALGATITEWVSYTPTFTGFGTVTGVNVRSRRVGDTLEVVATVTTGTVTGTEARMTLGFNGTDGGLTIDSTKVPVVQCVGTGVRSVTGALQHAVLAEGGDTYFTFGLQAGSVSGMTQANGSTIFASNKTLGFFMAVPIDGW